MAVGEAKGTTVISDSPRSDSPFRRVPIGGRITASPFPLSGTAGQNM